MRRVHSQTTRIYKTYWVVKSCCSIWHLRYITNSPLWGSIVRDFKECDVQHIILGRWENMPESMTYICCLYQWTWYNTARLPVDSSDSSWTLTRCLLIFIQSFTWGHFHQTARRWTFPSCSLSWSASKPCPVILILASRGNMRISMMVRRG